MLSIPEQLCEAGKIMFEKRLTDMAGGSAVFYDTKVKVVKA